MTSTTPNQINPFDAEGCLFNPDSLFRVMQDKSVSMADTQILFKLLNAVTKNNQLHVVHNDVAAQVGRWPSHVTRSITRLRKANIVQRIRRDKYGVHYMVNPSLFWSGSKAKQREAVAAYEARKPQPR